VRPDSYTLDETPSLNHLLNYIKYFSNMKKTVTIKLLAFFSILLLVILIITNYFLLRGKRLDTIIPLSGSQISSINQISYQHSNNKKMRLYFIDLSCRSCKAELDDLSLVIDKLLNNYDIYILSTKSNYHETLPQNVIRKIDQKDGVYFVYDKERVHFATFKVMNYPSVFDIDKSRQKMTVIHN